MELKKTLKKQNYAFYLYFDKKKKKSEKKIVFCYIFIVINKNSFIKLVFRGWKWFVLFYYFWYYCIHRWKYDKGGDKIINNVILVGRTTEDIKVNKTSDGRKVATITLAVVRPFKSAETGEYETDFIPVVLWEGIVDSIASLVKKGSTIGVKGRLVIRYIEVNEQKFRTVEVIGERVTYINLKQSKEQD